MATKTRKPRVIYQDVVTMSLILQPFGSKMFQVYHNGFLATYATEADARALLRGRGIRA